MFVSTFNTVRCTAVRWVDFSREYVAHHAAVLHVSCRVYRVLDSKVACGSAAKLNVSCAPPSDS